MMQIHYRQYKYYYDGYSSDEGDFKLISGLLDIYEFIINNIDISDIIINM